MSAYDLTILRYRLKSSLMLLSHCMKGFDFVSRRFLDSVQSPVVFCHNDLQEGNILLRSEPSAPNSNSSHQSATLTSDHLIIIDFEYCSYNYRGFDFANHMCEWMYDYSNEQPPYFFKRPDSYPSKEQQENFVRSYLRAYYACGPPTVQSETHLFTGKGDREDEVQQVLAEIKAFTLASHLFWALWSAVYSSVSTITFDYWVSDLYSTTAAFLRSECSEYSSNFILGR